MTNINFVLYIELMTIGKKVQELRQKKQLTLRQLSKLSGCSLGFLSQVERDLVSPTVSSLKKIADALEVNIMHFFDHPSRYQRVVVKKEERNKLVNPKSKVTYELLRPQFSDTELEALYMYLEPGAYSGKELHSHNGEEFVIVLKGELEITVGDEVFHLKEGDSAIYKSNIPHGWKNPGEITTEVIWVNHPPTF
ncbi:transcriptional regulator [Deferribacter desulfuricans SSM1]|uniref:Transcriptional regulator n=2 Tax=Deferribacter TaxID=53572 RepID=D3PD58_DEFDS|nr:transcriptional regulator [Deferribacter desulfuricans SSM1]